MTDMIARNIGDRERPAGRRVYEDIVDLIMQQITDGTLKPGEMLPPERQMAEDLHVSRTAVREALHTLASLGYVESRVGDGTFIREVTLDNILKPFSGLLSRDKQLIRDVLDVRILLEAESVRRAAIYATEKDIRSLEKIIDEMKESLDAGQDGSAKDAQFHQLLADTAGNEAISRILNMCSDLLFTTTKLTLSHPGRSLEAVEDHRRIVRMLREHNAQQAMKEMRTHLQKGYPLIDLSFS